MSVLAAPAALLRLAVRDRTQLALENIALRQQVAVLKRSVKRPQLRKRDRLFWVLLRRLWPGWRSFLLVVRPATVVAWHRQGWRLLWKRRSRGKPGRPAIALEVRDLIRRLSRENRFWGAPRIQDELKHLGHVVAKSTVEKYMSRPTGPPSPTWRTFLRNHAGEVLACDFFTIPTASFKTLTGFVVIELGRRRILAINATRHPSAEWAAGIVERAFDSGGRVARYLLRDRDGIYGQEFKAAVRSLALQQVVTAYKAPRMNAHCERLIGTLRRELLDHVIVLGESHACRLLGEFAAYYNPGRGHQALGGDAPIPRAPASAGGGYVVRRQVLGGLHHVYARAA